jgi:hypothetical protein
LADDFVLLRTVRGVPGLTWPFTHNDLGQPGTAGHFYRPLWVLWNYSLYSVAHTPVIAHVANLALFGVLCAEVAILLRRLSGARGAVTGGLFFAAFPSHGESVAWISGDTDLLAVTLGLAALLFVLTNRPCTWKAIGAATFTAAAMLSKEVAVVFPILAVLVLPEMVRRHGAILARRHWWPVAGMFLAVAAVLIARSLVLQGLGGYGTSSLTAPRAAGSLASFSVAAVSAPQFEVLHHPLLLAVSALLVGVCGWVIYRGYRAAQRQPVSLALRGVAWFLIALLPVLNQPLNLNTSNGDRLLLLPSVGLAIMVAAIMTIATRRRATVAWAAVIIASGVACLAAADTWRVAGRESRRLLGELVHLAPPHSRVVMLSYPTEYRSAHLYPDALQEAVQASGRPDVALTTCAPVQVLRLRPNQVTLRRSSRADWLGTTTPEVPFNVSVFGHGVTTGSPNCPVATAPVNAFSTPGTASAVIIRPAAAIVGMTRLLYFDGRDVRAAG